MTELAAAVEGMKELIPWLRDMQPKVRTYSQQSSVFCFLCVVLVQAYFRLRSNSLQCDVMAVFRDGVVSTVFRMAELRDNLYFSVEFLP